MIESFNNISPVIAPDAFVHPNSTIIGEVIIGSRSSVWPAVVLRGDMGRILIGNDTSVQDGSIVHLTEGWSESIIGNCVTIGHGVIIHGCQIEDHCLIGMGAIVMDKAVIGEGSLVAACALVTPQTLIPPRSLVRGSPAKVIREVNEKERGMIEGGWMTYQRYTALYIEQYRST